MGRKVKILQYPRGVNKGGGISIDYCPTISTSSFQHNCFLIVYDSEKICVKDRAERLRQAGRRAYERGEIRLMRMEVKQYTARFDGVSNTITGVQKDNWILCATTQ